MRNRARVDRRGLILMGTMLPVLALGACELPGQSPPPRQFRVTPKTTFDELPHVNWALAVDRPTIDRSIDTTRIARINGVEVEFYADAAWVDRPPPMIQPMIIQSFRNSGAIAVVTDRRSEVRPDFMLQTDIIAFQAHLAESGPPEVRVMMAAKLIAMPRRDVVGTTEIGRTVPAAAGDLPSIVAAFDEALGKVLKRLVEWTLVTGEAAEVAT
ncbi:MAG: ABC-type transport auxiliary lipoprotein family protein [Geminicoccaceae bacterium]